MTATVIVAGAVANKHRHGGEAWVRMSWASGLRALGFDVVFVEQIAPEACVGRDGRPAPFAVSANRAAFAATIRAFGFDGRAALVCGDRVDGMERGALLQAAEEAGLLVNVSGHLRDGPVFSRVRRRAYVDIDPGFTQVWHEQGLDAGALAAHDLHFTIGENIGTPRCPLPTGGLRWRAIRQPVVLADWAGAPADGFAGFTTVASWRGAYGPVTWAGTTYGVKAHEFRRFAELPRRSGARCEIALDIDPADAADADLLRRHGWRLVDPDVAADVERFRAYVLRSSAELSAAQGVYVATRSGWFSDRTVRYLAAGRPALVQDTGFGDHLPVGEGIVPFRSLQDAVRGAEAIAADYDVHCRAARRTAAECFAAERVLPRLLEDAGVAP